MSARSWATAARRTKANTRPASLHCTASAKRFARSWPRLGIDVLVAAAGPTDTEHFDTLLEEHGEMPWGNPRRKPADEVARSIVRAIERGRHEVFTHWGGWLWVLLNRLAPGIVDRIMTRYRLEPHPNGIQIHRLPVPVTSTSV